MNIHHFKISGYYIMSNAIISVLCHTFTKVNDHNPPGSHFLGRRRLSLLATGKCVISSCSDHLSRL